MPLQAARHGGQPPQPRGLALILELTLHSLARIIMECPVQKFGGQPVMQDFAGKPALVTGSNSGPGKVAAQQLARRGAHVIRRGRDTARGAAPAGETRLAEVTEVRNVIVIGSGPSGYTAALYAARAELKPLVFEGSVTAGGALMQTTDVENFPGFPDAIMGPELMDSMRKQAERFGAELLSDDVTAVDLTADPKVVKTDSEI